MPTTPPEKVLDIFLLFFFNFKPCIMPLIFIFITYYYFAKRERETLFLKANFICIYFIFLWLFFFNIVFLKIQPLLCIFNLCFLVVINFVPLRTQSPVPTLTWEQEYWLDCSLPLWTLLFLHQVASVSSLPLLFSTQICESLCVPEDGEHLGNWLLAGSVSLLLIPPFYPPGHLCLLPPSFFSV